VLQPPISPASDEIPRNPGHASALKDTEDGHMPAASSNLETHRPVQPTSTRTAVGNYSGATYVQDALSPHATHDLGDIRSGLGLENVPMSRTDESQQLRDSFQRSRIVDLSPQRSEAAAP
jgi:hypothetical protein